MFGQEYAKVVVDEAWFRLQTQGWDHPAWREAYCLGQLCLACAYNCLDRDAAERISTGNPDSQDRGPGNRSEASQSEAEEASQSEAAAESVQPTPAPCQTADSKQAQPLRSHIAANAAADAAQQQPCLSAMRVLDLATIMGAPSAMVQPLVTVIEPKAQQYLQATLAHQTDNASCSHQLSDAEPADVPKLDSARNIARQQVQGLSPNGFKKLFWKTDTPVIITGAELHCSLLPITHITADVPANIFCAHDNSHHFDSFWHHSTQHLLMLMHAVPAVLSLSLSSNATQLGQKSWTPPYASRHIRVTSCSSVSPGAALSIAIKSQIMLAADAWHQSFVSSTIYVENSNSA